VGSPVGGEALLSVDRVEGEVVLNQNLVAVLLVTREASLSRPTLLLGKGNSSRRICEAHEGVRGMVAWSQLE
jgi:hypothetical protein